MTEAAAEIFNNGGVKDLAQLKKVMKHYASYILNQWSAELLP
jgi:hypothetical protein